MRKNLSFNYNDSEILLIEMNSKHATLDLFSLLTSSKMVNNVRFNLLL